jgi:hypothetical protein
MWREMHPVIVWSHTDVVSGTTNRPHSDSGHAQLPCGSRWDIELMRQPHSSARHCDGVIVSSHTNTTTSSIELNDSDSVAITSDTSCRHTPTASH